MGRKLKKNEYHTIIEEVPEDIKELKKSSINRYES